jgi:hypothetical protein
MTVPASRMGRYGDWTPVSTGGVDERRPFFAGTAVGDRMAQLRRAIHEIRVHWNQYPVFMAELRDVLAHGDAALSEGDAARHRAELFFSSRKDWEALSDDDDFTALRLYTSDAGYRRIFRTINAALRGGAVVDNERAIRTAAFLIEMITIDLFHYRVVDQEADNFEGFVYRGMCVDDVDLARFARLTAAPVGDRYLSVPLALMSASTDAARAVDFALRESAARLGAHPIVWRIHVVGLEPDLMGIYQRRFPSSVVTSICAVPIHQVSDYPHEREVLLRGPFFQVLRISPGRLDGGGGPLLQIIDAVMLNSNRDHISAIASDEGDDRAARELFRLLVNVERARVCGALAAEFSSEDARLYESMCKDWQQQLADVD